MIRILHYIGELQFGGSQAFVMELYRKLDKSRFQFDFVTFPNQGNTEYYREIIDYGGKVYECPQYNGKNHFKFVKWWKSFFKNHGEYKVLHGHVRSVASIYIPIAKSAGCFTIAHSHSTSNGHGFSSLIKDLYQYPVRYQADYMMACSLDAGLWMFGKRVINSDRYKTFPNAIDARVFVYSSEERLRMRSQLGVSADTLLIGHVGRMTYPKNHSFLIQVFYDLQKQCDAKLLLVGDGELRTEIEKQIFDYGIEDRCILVGSQRNVQDYYQAIDIFAFPSFWEGFGISVIEAQASGLPCVVSNNVPRNVSVIPELVTFVDLNKQAWVDYILDYKGVERINRHEDIIKAGFDITSNIKQIEELYLNAAES